MLIIIVSFWQVNLQPQQGSSNFAKKASSIQYGHSAGTELMHEYFLNTYVWEEQEWNKTKSLRKKLRIKKWIYGKK